MRRGILVVLAMLATVVPARAHVGSHEVAVRDGFFDPQELRIDVGETVTWNVFQGGHTITADDGRFDFPGDRLTRQGDRFQWTFTDDETFTYHCKVHTTVMFGVIVVGDGSPPRPPSGDAPEIRAVPGEYATIADAVAGAPDDTIIEVGPGIYREAVTLDVPGLTVRGVGANRGEVAVDGMSQIGIGFTIAAERVRIQHLTIRRYTFAGVFADRARRFTIDDVALIDNDRYGLRSVAADGGVVRDSAVRGALRAGISIEGCVDCDVFVDGIIAEANLAGVAATNAGGVVVRGSTFRGNGTGVALKTLPGGQHAPQRGAHVLGNLIEDNTWRPHVRPPATDSFEIPTGVGVWLSGGLLDVVEANTIRGHLYNVAVTGFTGPSIDDRVVGNIVGGAREADLAWDGVGATVCFARNTRPDGSPPSSTPVRIEALYACGLPATAGIPYPLVNSTILLHAGL